MTTLTAGEHAARRALQIQKAVRANPRSPNFDGLDHYLRHLDFASGIAHTPAVAAFIAQMQEAEASHRKALRHSRDEEDARTKEAGKPKRRRRKGGGLE